MKYSEVLNQSRKFINRRYDSEKKAGKIREALDSKISITKYKRISIYCGGSLGRADVGSVSDLDIFILSSEKSCAQKRLDELELLSEIININKDLGYPRFSNDGQYLKVYSLPDMLDGLGSPLDDNENLFTVRMLLLLESKPLFNENLYDIQINSTIEHYFRDRRGKSSFKPLYLMNDILRYWRTLCLNYELIRNDTSLPWRKKNINLKFSRMLTVFGTIIPLITEPASTEKCVNKLIKKTPMERLAYGLDMLDSDEFVGQFVEFVNVYEEFLVMKEKMKGRLKIDDESFIRRSREMAKMFSDFLYSCLNHENINQEYRKYLIL